MWWFLVVSNGKFACLFRYLRFIHIIMEVYQAIPNVEQIL